MTHSHGADGEHSHKGTASYTWLDFEQAAEQATALAAAMQRRMPELFDDIDAGLSAVLADLAALDAEARSTLTALQGTTILATHPRYQYFARAYGLDITSLAWEAGAMPDDGQWADIQAIADQTAASLLIWEAAPPAAALDRAHKMGLTSVVFSPLATRPASGDFLSVMRGQIANMGSAR